MAVIAKDMGYEFVNLDDLTRRSDFIFLAAPLTNETMNLCDKAFFAKMKKNGILINISRGQLVKTTLTLIIAAN